MSEDEAPASVYLRAVPTCTAGFVYTRGVRQLKNVATTAPIVNRTPFHPSSMLGVSLTLVLMSSLLMSGI